MPATTAFPGLAGKRVLVTGASSGIGAAIARLLGEQGACVAVHYRQGEEGARRVARAIAKAGGRAEPIKADLGNARARSRLVPAAVRALGGLDILVNNAGWAVGYEDFRTLPEDSWHRTFAVNAAAPFVLSRLAWGHLEKAADGGRIINISSAAVRYGGSPSNVHYVASKAALEGLTVSLAKHGAPAGIRVNAIRCGVTDTPMPTRLPGYDRRKFLKRARMVPLGRAGQPEEIAAMAAFLASAAGSFITGQIIAVAGGD